MKVKEKHASAKWADANWFYCPIFTKNVPFALWVGDLQQVASISR